MRFNAQSTVKLALIGAAVLSLAACASKPTPGPGPGPSGPGPSSGGGSYIPPAGPGPIDSRPIPGTTQDFIINIGDFVYFDLDQYVIRADAAPVLDAQSAWLRRWANVRVRIEGNCDERGTREYNLDLGSRRANAVREYLIARGVAPSRIATLSNGKERPIDAGTSEDAYQRNRNGQTVIVDGAR